METIKIHIREGSTEEIQDFQLYDPENEGEEILVAEKNNEIIGYVQMTGCEIYFIESVVKGGGKALIEHVQSEFDELRAISCLPAAIGFYEHLGFERMKSKRWNHPDYIWYAD